MGEGICNVSCARHDSCTVLCQSFQDIFWQQMCHTAVCHSRHEAFTIDRCMLLMALMLLICPNPCTLLQYDNNNKKEIVKRQTSAMNGNLYFQNFFLLSKFHGVGVDHGLNNYCIKTPNPKCHHYWCLIKFIDWRYSQSCWYFRPALWTL